MLNSEAPNTEHHTLVLLPGMDGTGDQFAPFIAALGSACRTIRVRYPDDPTMGYGELEAFVRPRLPQNGAYVVLAESFSGPVAAALSAAPPPGMVGAVLCCTFLRNPRPQLAPLTGLLPFAPIKAAPVPVMASVLLGRYSTAGLRAALVESLAQVSDATLRARLRAVVHVDARAQLAAAQVPVLYLQASEDRLLSATAAADVRASLPSTTVVSIVGPHLLLQACPGPAAEAVLRFVVQTRSMRQA